MIQVEVDRYLSLTLEALRLNLLLLPCLLLLHWVSYISSPLITWNKPTISLNILSNQKPNYCWTPGPSSCADIDAQRKHTQQLLSLWPEVQVIFPTCSMSSVIFPTNMLASVSWLIHVRIVLLVHLYFADHLFFLSCSNGMLSMMTTNHGIRFWLYLCGLNYCVLLWFPFQ